MPNTTEYFTVDRSPEMGRDCPLSLLLSHIIDWKRRFSPTTHIHLVGHSFGAKLVTSAAVFSLALRASKPGVWLGDESGAIESLVILNPAFDPEELDLPNNSFGKKPGEAEGAFSSVRMLEKIPRKVLVYSDRDYATGRLFDLGQMIMSHSFVQMAERSWIEQHEHNRRLKEGVSSLSMSPWIPTFWVAKGIFYSMPAIMAIYGSLINTATSVASGPPQWAINKLFYLPGDFVYHILKTDLFLKKEEATGYRVVLRGAVNTIDFFVPIWHVMRNDPADQMGILRNPSPALGSTGLSLATAGRPINLRGISRLFENGQTPPMLFCRYSSRILKDPSLNDSAVMYDWDGVSQLDAKYPRLDPNVMQSFDGTTVLDTWYPPDGAHGDVRSTEPPSQCSAQDETGHELQKREMIFNFVYNVTHARLVPGLRSGAHTNSQLP